MSSKRSKLSDQQWDDYKALIREWYIVKDRSLKEVHNKLKEQGLDATTHQLETKIKKWKFLKNIGKETWIHIDHHITKRKRDGKESEVILSGKRIKPETVRRETDRYGDRSILAKIALERNSSLPPLTDWQVAVCTPQPITMEFEWPITLPWLRFSSRELPMTLEACKPFPLESRNAASSDLVSAILPEALRTEMAHIGVSKLAAIIGRSMPETYPQESIQHAQNLLSRSADDFAREYVSMVIYNVSNNLLDLKESSKWEQTLGFLEDYGIFRLDVDLGKDRGPTIDGFMENLFDASIHRCLEAQYHHPGGSRAETAVKWILRLGYCPKIAVETLWTGLEDFRVAPPYIQQPILDLTRHLLNAGASADILVKYRGKYQTILEIALKQDRWSSDAVFNLAELLFKHGASRNLDRALHLAIRRKEKDLVEMIIQNEDDLTTDLEPLSRSPLHKETALTVAASTGLQQTRHILDLLSSRYPSIPVTTFITPDVFIAAAAKGHDDIIQYLYTISRTITANEYGITPLHVAARYGHLSTCQILRPLQVPSNTWATTKFSPIQAACYGGHTDVVEFFVMNGANVDADPRFDSFFEELQLVERFDMCYYLPRKAPLNLLFHVAQGLSETDPRHSDILHCAIILIRAGAKLVGEELSIAASFCHSELLAAGIEAGANPNGLDREGETPLQRALQGPSNRSDRLYGVVSQLLSKGAQLLGGEVDSAVDLEQWEVAILLIEHGGNMTKAACIKQLEKAISVRDNALAARLFELEPSIYSAGALYAAIETRNDSLIQSLILNRRAEKREDPFEITAIAAAAISGNLVLLQELLTHPPSCRTGPLPLRKEGKDIDYYVVPSLVEIIRSGKYRTGNRLDLSANYEILCGSPLALVASSIRSDVLEACSQLLGSGFCADELTWVVAAHSDNTAFVQILLDHNQHGDYDYQGFQDCSPLACAIENRSKDMINLLLTAGVDINGRVPCVGEPLLAAVIKGDLDIVRYLVQAGADVNACDKHLHDPSDVNIIMRHLCNRSPIQAAVEWGKTDIMHYLVQAGANVNSPPARCEGATALQFAAIKGYLGLAKYLIDRDAQVNAPPSREEGRTALQGAAEHGRLDMLEFLLTEGALTGGRWRRRFIKAVKLAITERHIVAANILKRSAGWSEEDEKLLQEVDVDCDTDSEGEN
ncbi:hypothetical protein ANO14919_059830 [Xylariales sp. No.14919]|nr:hypothetical protein ANO14919_059830 [Xylariales sp. No.14919]